MKQTHIPLCGTTNYKNASWRKSGSDSPPATGRPVCFPWDNATGMTERTTHCHSLPDRCPPVGRTGQAGRFDRESIFGLKISFFILFFVFLFECHVSAEALTRDDAVDVFYRANKEYNAGQKAIAEKREREAVEKFEHAVQLYEKLLESNFVNGQIYYNLGNAYYRQGMPGKAIIYYRRAEKLLPRDANIKANINLLKSDFEDKESIRQVPEILKIMCFWYFFLNLNEITIITIYIYLALIASILSVIFYKVSMA
ncbi:MAG: hypothetical protein SCARUB_03416 [Candidatus Scalindua rubra]|uniref:Uncharacterized protein n=1 Tax=Candidatus Scalindua rubra TaxID=1872076 RepID=A0A1E3X7C8_9BACT|nr:MAG: hypothetical protein SCARUB_03416 [Candidatus Scalindua rubra]